VDSIGDYSAGFGRYGRRIGFRSRPRDQWVWSATPTHEPIVSRELFDQVEERAQANGRAAKAGISCAAHKARRPKAQRLYPLRGRLRCGMCEHRMEERLLDPIIDFLGRRVFGADRLRLLRDELAASTASSWEEHDAEAKRLESELETINRSLRTQTLRLEEHDDPSHPVVALATERIGELSTRKAAVTGALDALRAKRPDGHHPDEIVAMLDTVPDLRNALTTADDEELAEIFRAFDLTITYDKPGQRLHLAATIAPGLLADLPNDNDHPRGTVAD
jgi:site-specific DNA recombinase